MKLKRTPMRYAHTNGHTNCTYSEKGDRLITCGSDGDIRIWQGIDDDDPSSKCLGEFVTCLLQYDNKLLVSTDLHTVQSHTFPDIDRDGTELRFTGTVTCIKTNKDYVVAGSEDTEIKVYKKDKSDSEFVLTGHQGPILSLAVSSANLLASCSGDGFIKIWDLSEKKEIKSISGLPKCKTFESVKLFGSPSFAPNGTSLAYASGKEIIILNTSTWETQFTLVDESITSEYSCCQFSPDGQFIAAGTQKGELSVWNFSSKKSINVDTSNMEEAHCITMIIWNPQNNGEYAYCDAAGQLGTVVGCLTGGVGEEKNDFLDDVAMESDGLDGDFDGIDFDGGDNDDDGVSLEKLKNDTMKANGLGDDENSKDSVKSFRSRSLSAERDRPIVKTYRQQSAFQPSSTPSDLEHRYLVWNEVGIVRAHAGDNDGSIDVEFHDSNTHHNLHMTNYLNHTIASLSTSVLALSGDLSTKFVCISLAASSSKEWSIDLPDCEGVVALVATNKLIAVGTDNRFVRFFTVMGTQREVISIPGPIVAMAGHEDKIMICYHTSPASEDQHIAALLVQTFGLTVRTRTIPIPLPPGKKLTWIGYSDRGSPAFSDTMGLVQIYSVKTNCWYPICDTMKHAQSVSNNFFIIDISETNQLLHAVLCRSSSYPMTHPRPMVVEVPMQTPLCDIETEKSQLEDTLMRSSNFMVEKSEKQVKETALKLFALACHSEMEGRAKELIEMIASPDLLPLAVKYASKLGRIHLADKLSELLPQLEEQQNEREREIREIETDAMTIMQSSPLLLVQRNSNRSETTPKLAPKPMVLSNHKRNPFKRSSAAGSAPSTPKDNPFSHLMDKAIQMRPTQTQSPLMPATYDDDEESVIGDSQEVSNENQAKNENAPREKFTTWYAKNKEDLQRRHPEAESVDLTKIGMREFKAVAGAGEATSAKRKLEPDSSVGGITEKQKISAKLAKFDFQK